MKRQLETNYIRRDSAINRGPEWPADLRMSPVTKGQTDFPPKIIRRSYVLPCPSQKLLLEAHTLANAISSDWHEARGKYFDNIAKWGKKLISDLKKTGCYSPKDIDILSRVVNAKNSSEDLVSIKTTNTTFDKFKLTAVKTCLKLGIKPSDEIISLAALFSCRQYSGQEAPFKKLPSNFFNESSLQSAETLGLLLRCVFHEKLKVKTASDLENLGHVVNRVAQHGLGSVAHMLNALELIETAYPGLTSGPDPVIRSWKIQQNQKWRGTEGLQLVARVSSWLLEYGTSVYDRKTNSFNIKKMERIDWGKAIAEAGLRHVPEFCPSIKNSMDFIRIGAEVLGHPNLIGIGEGQLKPWDVMRFNMWKEVDEEGKLLIDHVTTYLVETDLRCKKPHLYANKGKGPLLAEKAKSYNGWSDAYCDIASEGLRKTGIKIPYALARVYPDLFGWGDNQMLVSDLRFTGKWDGPQGTELFREAFANALYRSGLGTYDKRSKTYTFTLAEFDSWTNKFMRQGEFSFIDFVRISQLSGGMKYSEAKDRVGSAVSILFKGEVTPQAKKLSVHFDASKLFRNYLLETDERFTYKVPDLKIWNRPEQSEAERMALRKINREKREIRLALLACTNLDAKKHKSKIESFVNRVHKGSALYFAALYGDQYDIGRSEFRQSVYALRHEYSFRSIHIKADNKLF